MNSSSSPSKSFFHLCRVVFVVYALALLTATHWPGLAVHGPFSRMDLVVHASVMLVWTVLLYATRWVAAGGCGCFKRRIAWTLVVGFCYAVFDELTQPMFGRVADPLDVSADWFGVLVACGVIWWWVTVRQE
ncbi:MAG: VanZ family protein [Phycisphaerales bacterium]